MIWFEFANFWWRSVSDEAEVDEDDDDDEEDEDDDGFGRLMSRFGINSGSHGHPQQEDPDQFADAEWIHLKSRL